MGLEMDNEKNRAHVIPMLGLSDEMEALRADVVDFFMSFELNFRRIDLVSEEAAAGGRGGIGSTSGRSTGCTLGCRGVHVEEEHAETVLALV